MADKNLFDSVKERQAELANLLHAIVTMVIKDQIRRKGSWTVDAIGSGDFDDEVVQKYSLQLSAAHQAEEDEDITVELEFVGEIVHELVELGCMPEIRFVVPCTLGDYESLDARSDLAELCGFEVTDPKPFTWDDVSFKRLVALKELLSKKYMLALMSQQ